MKKSGAKAHADFVGLMRGLKPPPPSGSGSLAAVKPAHPSELSFPAWEAGCGENRNQNMWMWCFGAEPWPMYSLPLSTVETSLYW